MTETEWAEHCKWPKLSITIYHIITHFLEKYVRIKIENHKILILISKLSPKLDEVNTGYLSKYVMETLWKPYYFNSAHEK